MNFGIELIAWVADLSVVELTGCVSSRMTQEFCQKASDLDLLKEAIKEKLKIANKEKVKFLTITPVSWSIQQTANFF